MTSDGDGGFSKNRIVRYKVQDEPRILGRAQRRAPG